MTLADPFLRESLGSGWRRALTHCPRGHRYSPGNTRITPSGKRVCRMCDARRKRKERAK